MGGMRVIPVAGLTREPDSQDHPPTRYKVWYKAAETDGEKVFLGRSERQLGHMQHKFYPVDGTWPKQIRGWVDGAVWLLECWRGAQARADAASAAEDEEVEELAAE